MWLDKVLVGQEEPNTWLLENYILVKSDYIFSSWRSPNKSKFTKYLTSEEDLEKKFLRYTRKIEGKVS